MSEIFPIKQIGCEKPAVDEHLYDAFLEVGSLQAYEYLNGDPEYRKEQRRQFIDGEIRNPTLDYPKLNDDELLDAESALITMKDSVISTEKNELVKQVYRWRLNEKIAEIRMLRAVASGDMHRFARYSEFIYGRPSTDIFAYTVGTIRSKAEQFQGSEDPLIRNAAESLLQVMPEMGQPEISHLPSLGTVEYAHSQTVNELGDLIEIPFDEPKLDAKQIQEAFTTALDRIDGSGWKIMIEEGSSRTGINTNQEKKSVTIPEERSVTKDKLAGLIVHEIGTHAARRINGERSRLKLLGIGLDRYEVGEEGIATMREQALTSKVSDFRGIDGQLAVGLGLGIDGRPRDFRQVYEIMEKYYLFRNLVAKKEVTEAQTKAQTSAWNHTVRAFRGADCSTPGVCLTKDAIYREGNIGVWNVIGENPSEMLRFNVGKYDPSNKRHLWILEQLGISDQDLKNLE